MGFNVAIDGPAGAGKSTIAKRVAKDLSFIYVDTGAMYRAVGLHMFNRNINPDNEVAVSEGCKELQISIRYENGEQQVILNGENVNDFIRNEYVGILASKTSGYPAVRAKLLDLQRQMAKEADVLMDGRDIGTTVLPNADVKIYLTADSSVRAQRRFDELKAKGLTADFDEIEADIIDRDRRDMTRDISPLKKAEDAIVVDSSHMTINEVVDHIKELVMAKRG